MDPQPPPLPPAASNIVATNISEEHAKARRKGVVKRTAAASNEDTKKQRGRPRMEPRDETAADRRRTQIRLAQRTYRARKESTIATLEGKVSRLQHAMQRTNGSLQTLYRLALDGDVARISPSLFTELTRSLAEIGMLVEESERDSSHSQSDHEHHEFKIEDSEDTRAFYQQVTPPPSEEDSQSNPSSNENDVYTVPKTPVDRPTIVATNVRGVPTVLGYEMIYDVPNPSQAGYAPIISQAPIVPSIEQQQLSYMTYGPPRPQQQYQSFYQPADAQLSLAYQQANTGHLSAASELPLPTTLAFHETSFNRWLYRYTLEFAYRVITGTDIYPGLVDKVFHHPLQFTTKDQIQMRLRHRLSLPADQSLDNEAEYMKVHPLLPNPVIGVNDDGTEMRHLDRPWLGPEDVENLCRLKGMKIDMSSGTATYHRDNVVEVPRTASNPIGWSMPSSDGTSFSSMSSESYASSKSDVPYVTQQDDVRTASSQVALYTGPVMGNSQTMLQRQRQRITLCLYKFINNLVDQSECRGKSPAYPRNGIENAMNNAVIQYVAV